MKRQDGSFVREDSANDAKAFPQIQVPIVATGYKHVADETAVEERAVNILNVLVFHEFVFFLFAV
jgi:hypothetical protein